MSARFAAASAVAASLFVCSLPAVSADLYAPPRAGPAYDDPRYGDTYGDDRPYRRYAEPEDFEPAYPPYRSLKDAPFPPPHKRYGRWWRDDGCVPRQAVRDRLRADGWYDFDDLEPRGSVVLVQARRPSGRLFDLTIDRCSGEIVEARPIHGARSFAYSRRRYWPHSY